MRSQGHPVRGALCGFFFGLFLTLALTVFASVPLNSVLYVVLPLVGLFGGIALGLFAPFGTWRPRRRRPAPQ
jgi:hypothetical protein